MGKQDRISKLESQLADAKRGLKSYADYEGEWNDRPGSALATAALVAINLIDGEEG